MEEDNQKQKLPMAAFTDECEGMVQDADGRLMTQEAYLNLFPMGYRFCPTDEELVVHYLKNKVLNKSLPINKIRSVKLYDYSPQQLSEMYEINGEKAWYFFTPRDRKYPKGSRPKRDAGNGFWKATGADTPIKSGGQLIGSKKALVFYEGKQGKQGKQGDKNSLKTNWIMYEYKVYQKSSAPSTSRAPGDMKLDEWVLCKVYKKAQKVENKPEDAPIEGNVDVDKEVPTDSQPTPPSNQDLTHPNWSICDYDYGFPSESLPMDSMPENLNTFANHGLLPMDFAESECPELSDFDFLFGEEEENAASKRWECP